jgi:hypothetical protein
MVNHYVKFIFKLFYSFFFIQIDPYKPPGPGVGTGPHRYIFLLYQSIDKIPSHTIANDQRLRFPLEKYVHDNQLGLLDATYFTIDG